MDYQKTGALIAAARKEKALTQKELAEQLHISDRTVSKWERGVGFPDVSLVEALCDTLGLTVTELLRGERTPGGTDSPEDQTEISVREALRVVNAEVKRRTKQVLYYGLIALLIVLGVAMGIRILVETPFSTQIEKTVPAMLYVDGAAAEDTSVTFDGDRSNYLFKAYETFQGTMLLDCYPRSAWNGTQTQIKWRDYMEEQQFLFFQAGTFLELEVKRWLLIDLDMDEFAIGLADGSVVATSDEMYASYVELLGGQE